MQLAIFIGVIILAGISIPTVIVLCERRDAIREAKNMEEFLENFPYKIEAGHKKGDIFNWGLFVKMRKCYIQVFFSMGYRSDGVYNYDCCYISGVNAWNWIHFNQGMT